MNRYGFSATRVAADGVNTNDVLSTDASTKVDHVHEVAAKMSEKDRLIAVRDWLNKELLGADPATYAWIEGRIDSVNAAIGKLSN